MLKKIWKNLDADIKTDIRIIAVYFLTAISLIGILALVMKLVGCSVDAISMTITVLYGMVGGSLVVVIYYAVRNWLE